ncbi:hypothetical protein C8F04DRAFT_350754 [Mycena alexandri]|uniref:Thaumatin-like protein n=1 Tax=Mycena alexandri TaxID=1745969 RepID=A0AAD6S2G6_9AGAR|nr:hypothetical protein C8F04DRAFT_350754 [Mycena alexandri]
MSVVERPRTNGAGLLGASPTQCSADSSSTSSSAGPTKHTGSVRFLNHCGFGTPTMIQPNGRSLSGGSANFPRRGIVFLDQGFCGPAEDLNCTALEINLGGADSNGSFVRIRSLATPFSVPVSFIFSGGCSSTGQCLNKTCLPQILECSARDASAVVTFCPAPVAPSEPPSTTRRRFFTTSPTSTGEVPLLSLAWNSHPPAHLLVGRARKTSKLLGAALGGALGGAAFLLLTFVAIVCIRRRRAGRFEARLPQPQVPFVVNPTWVLASPTTAEGSHSHLSLPDRARPRTIPLVPHQASMPNLATQYRTRVLRPRASTVGSVLARTETSGAREPSAPVVYGRPTRSHSESSMWRPRIDILGSRQRAEGSGPAQAMNSFWAV